MRRIDRDSLPHLAMLVLDNARWRTTTALARTFAWWWGIRLGPGCRFYGLPILRRLPGTRIDVAEGCDFRSGRWSNLVGINRPCMISTLVEGARIDIGPGCGLSGTVIGAATRITLGAQVMCGANVTITDTDWHPVSEEARYSGGPAESAPVEIGDRVWLSMNVTVLKGVTIGPGTVVAAGSTVSRSLPGGVVAGGSPAKVLRSLT